MLARLITTYPKATFFITNAVTAIVSVDLTSKSWWDSRKEARQEEEKMEKYRRLVAIEGMKTRIVATCPNADLFSVRENYDELLIGMWNQCSDIAPSDYDTQVVASSTVTKPTVYLPAKKSPGWFW